MDELHDALTELFTTVYSYSENVFKRTLKVKSAFPRSNYPFARPLPEQTTISDFVVKIPKTDFGYQSFLPGGPLVSSSGDSYILIKASSELFTDIDWDMVKEVFITDEWTGKEVKESTYEVLEKLPVGTSNNPVGLILTIKKTV